MKEYDTFLWGLYDRDDPREQRLSELESEKKNIELDLELEDDEDERELLKDRLFDIEQEMEELL